VFYLVNFSKVKYMAWEEYNDFGFLADNGEESREFDSFDEACNWVESFGQGEVFAFIDAEKSELVGLTTL